MDAYAIGVASSGAALFLRGESMLYDYGGRMSELLQEKSITPKALSKKTRISISIIYAFLNYNLPIDMVIFEKMLKAINVSVIEFFRADKKSLE